MIAVASSALILKSISTGTDTNLIYPSATLSKCYPDALGGDVPRCTIDTSLGADGVHLEYDPTHGLTGGYYINTQPLVFVFPFYNRVCGARYTEAYQDCPGLGHYELNVSAIQNGTTKHYTVKGADTFAAPQQNVEIPLSKTNNDLFITVRDPAAKITYLMRFVPDDPRQQILAQELADPFFQVSQAYGIKQKSGFELD